MEILAPKDLLARLANRDPLVLWDLLVYLGNLPLRAIEVKRVLQDRMVCRGPLETVEILAHQEHKEFQE